MSNALKIVILDGYAINPGDNPWDEVSVLGDCTVYDRTPPDLVLERATGAQVILLSKVKITSDLLGKLPDLRFISMLATGYNNVDVEAAGRKGVAVSNVPAYSTDSVVQTAFALILELATHVGLHDQAVKAGEWIRSPDPSFWKCPIIELAGLTIGIVGFGTIGRAIARVALAFGMHVIAYAPRPPEASLFPEVRFVTVEELFSQSDIVSLNCPQTAENGGFVNRNLLSSMKRTAMLINVARGGLVNEVDLASALCEGVIAGAGLDVVAHEPMLPDNPLLLAPNCVFTPHIAWASLAARKRLTRIVAANIAAYMNGAPINVVNSRWLKTGEQG